jgi:hypothetical protein
MNYNQGRKDGKGGKGGKVRRQAPILLRAKAEISRTYGADLK